MELSSSGVMILEIVGVASSEVLFSSRLGGFVAILFSFFGELNLLNPRVDHASGVS